MTLPDIQGTTPEVQRHIQQVGVEKVTVPMLLQGKDSDEFYSVPANVSMRVFLGDTTKGISMSRCTRTLVGYLDKPLKKSLIKVLLNELCEKVESDHAFVKFEFELPIQRHSPISDFSLIWTQFQIFVLLPILASEDTWAVWCIVIFSIISTLS